MRAFAPGAVAPHSAHVLAYRASLLRPLLHGANVRLQSRAFARARRPTGDFEDERSRPLRAVLLLPSLTLGTADNTASMKCPSAQARPNTSYLAETVICKCSSEERSSGIPALRFILRKTSSAQPLAHTLVCAAVYPVESPAQNKGIRKRLGRHQHITSAMTRRS